MKLKKMVCVLSVMLCLFSLTGCYSSKNSNIEEKKDAQVEKVLDGHKMILISSTSSHQIFVDSKSKVVYWFYRPTSSDRGGLTPLYNADGSLVLFDGDLSLYEK